MSDSFQFQSLFKVVARVSTTVNFGNAATGSGTFASVDVTVTGATLGDMVLGPTLGVDTVDAVVAGAVTAANTVTLTLLNNTAGAVDLASTTAKFIVLRPQF